MDYLWTPWRYAYVAGIDKTSGCVFCDLPKSGDDAKAGIVYRGPQCYVVLNAYPYTAGHVMIVPYAHLDELQKLPVETAHEMMDLAQRMEQVLRQLRQWLANRVFTDVEDLQEALIAALQTFWDDPHLIVRLTNYPWWQAATSPLLSVSS